MEIRFNIAIQYKICRKKSAGCIVALLGWLIMRHCLLERFLKDHQFLEPYFLQKNFLFWIPYQIQFLQIVTFPSYYNFCNSYSQVFQLTGSNSATESKSYNKLFLFFKHIFNREFFLFGNPGDFKVCQISIGLAIFSDSFSSRYCFFFCLIVLWMSFRASLSTA